MQHNNEEVAMSSSHVDSSGLNDGCDEIKDVHEPISIPIKIITFGVLHGKLPKHSYDLLYNLQELPNPLTAQARKKMTGLCKELREDFFSNSMVKSHFETSYKEISVKLNEKLKEIAIELETQETENIENNEDLLTLLDNKHSVAEFIETDRAMDILADCTELEFDESSIEYLNHPLTTMEIIEACEDLTVLEKEDFKMLLIWRTFMRDFKDELDGLDTENEEDDENEQEDEEDEEDDEQEESEDDEEDEQDKGHFVIAICCHKGKHRSVSFAEILKEKLSSDSSLRSSIASIDVIHRDIHKKGASNNSRGSHKSKFFNDY